MVFKKTSSWKACYDEENDRYTAETGGGMAYDLYEITKDIFDQLNPKIPNREAINLISQGRHLYMSVNDRCGPPYHIVFDQNYRELCPWASIVVAEDSKGAHFDSDPIAKNTGDGTQGTVLCVDKNCELWYAVVG